MNFSMSKKKSQLLMVKSQFLNFVKKIVTMFGVESIVLSLKKLMIKRKKKMTQKNLGCGNSFVGGRCEKSDVINCVYPTENATT